MNSIVTAAAIYASSDGIKKLLGPTFEYMGEGLKNTVEKLNVAAKENVGKIINKAIGKKNAKLEEEGRVSPRILKDVIIDGAFCDTNVLQEYYSGILAGARTLDGDDNDIFYLNILKNLSSKQLKLHYVIYSKFLNTYKGEVVNLHESVELDKHVVNFTLEELHNVFNFEIEGNFDNLTSNIMSVLYSVGLLKGYSFDLKRKPEQFSFTISLTGLSLFLRALGYSEIFTPSCLSDPLLDEALKNIVSFDEL